MILANLVAYIVGSIPTGYWFAKYFFGLDITEHGSGNIGASNIARVLGKKYFIVIFLIDALKAYFILSIFQPSISLAGLLLTAVFLLLGNAHSIFLNFQGGKGIATVCGILMALAPSTLGVMFVLSWLFIIIATHKAYVASMISVFLVTLGCWSFGGEPELFFFLVFLNVWTLYRHKSNLVKLYCSIS